MSSAKPFAPLALWCHVNGPNPWKVAFVLEELGLPFELKFIEFPDMKQPAYEKININGRIPAVEDPNTGITLWESGAIIEYLVETYDKRKVISFQPGTDEYFKAKQWLFFQVSGQGPYFGQAIFFHMFNPEPIPSAVDRYVNEIKRVSGVLDRALAGKEYLVGNKYSYVDIAFLPWFRLIYFPWYSVSRPPIFKDRLDLRNYPNLEAWIHRLNAKPALSKVLEERDGLVKAAEQ